MSTSILKETLVRCPILRSQWLLHINRLKFDKGDSKVVPNSEAKDVESSTVFNRTVTFNPLLYNNVDAYLKSFEKFTAVKDVLEDSM